MKDLIDSLQELEHKLLLGNISVEHYILAKIAILESIVDKQALALVRLEQERQSA